MKNTFLAILYTIIVSVAVVEILILGYLSEIHILVIGSWTLGTIYGIFVNVHILLQMFLAYHNRGLIRHLRKCARLYKYKPTASILSTGYNENNNLLRQHYQSILQLKDPFKRYWFMSDGLTTDKDNTMQDLFIEIFPDGVIVELPFALKHATSSEQKQLWRQTIKAIKHR